MSIELATTEGSSADDVIRAASPLAIRSMTVSYGQKPAVFSVDMTVEPGKMTAIHEERNNLSVVVEKSDVSEEIPAMSEKVPHVVTL